MAMTHSLAHHHSELDNQGWTILPAMLAPALVDALNAQLPHSLTLRDTIRQRNGVMANNDGTLHHLLADHDCYLDVLKALEPCSALFQRFFDGNYILNSYGGVVNRSGASAYVHNVHRDIRFASASKRFMLNVLVMLDDFTLENGATHLLSGSQHQADKPDDAAFFAQSARALGQRGALLLFDSRLWHATGQNHTPGLRRALTLTLTCPFFKQQLDYPRMLGTQHPAIADPYLRQIIGYNARVPSTLEEFYVPLEHRFYQRGQDD